MRILHCNSLIYMSKVILICIRYRVEMHTCTKQPGQFHSLIRLKEGLIGCPEGWRQGHPEHHRLLSICGGGGGGEGLLVARIRCGMSSSVNIGVVVAADRIFCLKEESWFPSPVAQALAFIGCLFSPIE